MRVGLAILVAVVGGAASAAAEDIPMPTVDYAAKVRIQGMEKPVTMRHKDGVLRMELDLDGETGVFLLDTRKGAGTMLIGEGEDRMAMDVGTAGGPVRLPSTCGAADFRKTGSNRVAGHACDVWSYTDPATKGTDTSCVTGDGILLSTTSGEGGMSKPVLEVTSLERKAQDAALFKVPPGVQRMSVPGIPRL